MQVIGLTGVTAIAGAGYDGYALLSDGTVRAWGDNQAGELGNGVVSTNSCGTNCSDVPVPVKKLTGVTAIAGYADGGYALLSNGTVWAWGGNNVGQLGDGTVSTTGCQCSDVPVPVKNLTGVTAIAGYAGGGYALLSNGTVRAWWYNNAGQLGDGTVSSTGCKCSDVPVPVTSLTGVTAIAASANSRGGYALLANGTVQAWGYNHDGELGNGTVSTTGCKCSDVPVPVTSLSGVAGIANGGMDGYALMSDGTEQAWGYNGSGALGNGSLSPAPCYCIDVPGQVANLGGIYGISGAWLDGYAIQKTW